MLMAAASLEVCHTRNMMEEFIYLNIVYVQTLTPSKPLTDLYETSRDLLGHLAAHLGEGYIQIGWLQLYFCQWV